MKRGGLQHRSQVEAVRAARRRVPGALRLRPTDVDIWRVTLDEQPEEAVAHFRPLLSPDEAERARKFFFERDRRRFVIGRGILRTLLARYLGCPVSEIAFRYGPNGKPMLPAEDGAPALHFNVAHSDSVALLAFSTAGEIGIDLERVRDLPDWEHIAATYFSPAEQARVRACPPEARRLEFFRAWTRQEAILKASGLGLGLSVGPISVPALTAESEGENPAFSVRALPELKLQALEPGAGFVGALAVPAPVRWATQTTWKFSQWLGRVAQVRRGRRNSFEQLANLPSVFL